MIGQVWYMYKPGEERKFASPIQPSAEWMASLRKEGYRIVYVEFGIPLRKGERPDETTTYIKATEVE